MLIQDISRYQQAINYPLMVVKGQKYIIAKVGGSLNVDSKFVYHYTNGKAAGMNIAGYYWDDPLQDGVAQAKHFLTTINGKVIAFLEIDFEHWWADWDKWTQARLGNIPESAVPVLSSEVIFNNFVAFYNYLVAHTDLNVVVYTATWFVNRYCPQAYPFLSNIYTHWADYSYFSTDHVFATWEQLESFAPVGKPIPGLSATYPLDKVLMMQWSGDKFTSDGVWADEAKTRYSDLDLNLWVNKTISIEQFSKLPGGIVVPPITSPTFVSSTKLVKVLNVPYISQIGAGADLHSNDCGAASAVMLVQGYTDQKPTVDQFYGATGVAGDVYLAAYQIITALSKYGISADWKISNLATLLIDLHSGRPVIALISYGVLVDAKLTQNITFRGFHFVTVVGYDAENIYVNDPLWKDTGGKEIPVPQDVFDRAWQQAGANPSLNPSFGCIVPNQVLGIPIVNTSTNYRVLASKLNIRSAPTDAVYNVIGTLYLGNIVQIESVDVQGWGKIAGKTQYVYMAWLVKI